MSNKLRVGLFYNLRQDFTWRKDHPKDADGDWDVIETIMHVKQSLEHNNYDVLDLKEPLLLLDPEVVNSIDIVFSFCEMIGYRFRESLVPALCELLKKPYVFSPPDALLISLDKNLCNLVVRQAGGKVPNWQIYQTKEITELFEISFPCLIKPSAEGSGMGINERSVVNHLTDLRAQISWIIEQYRQPALVQEFMSGREFTIGVIETEGEPLPFIPLELCPLTQEDNFTYHHGVKEKADQLVAFRALENDQPLTEQIQILAVTAFKAVGCRDAARVDIRLSESGIAHFLEINPLPHLHPKIGDFCRSALEFGMDYDELIRTIMENAVRRFNLR